MEFNLLTLKQAHDFIYKYYSDGGIILLELQGGKHSVAFSYTYNKEDLVVRFNNTDFGFKKDVHVGKHYSHVLKLPSIIDIGQCNNNIHYSISKKITSQTVQDEYKKEIFTSFPLQFETIETISSLLLPPGSNGYGEWDPETLDSPFDTFQEYIKATYKSERFFNWQKSVVV